jgi:hypothetical protein
MPHEIRFKFGDNTSTVVFDGNAVRMNNELASIIYNYLVDSIVEEAVKTIEKSTTEFIHLMLTHKVIIRLKRQDGDIVEATIVFDELSEEDRALLVQGEE